MTKTVAGLLARGQTNFFKMLFKFNSVYNPNLQLADHARPVTYEMSPPPAPLAKVDATALYVHRGQGRRGRQIDNVTEQFVEDTRMGVAD
jgi:hopanoid C-3 methylase